jgi:hypothetical protein
MSMQVAWSSFMQEIFSSKQTDALKFDKHLHASPKDTIPPGHICHNLSGERGYVHARR